MIYSIFHIERLNKINKEETINLMQFLWGSIYQYHLNCGVKNGNYETFNSNREISAKKVSDLLGISYLISNIKIAKVTIDNNYSMIGTLMDEAEGISPYDISMSKRKNFTSQFSLDLSSLNIMDAINTEKDHRPGNYNIVYKDGKIITLQAFDNDSPESFGFSFNINLKTYLGGGPLISNNILNYGIIDIKLYNSIMKLRKKDIFDTFKDELSLIQKMSIYYRIKKMKKIINNSISHGMILSDNNMKNKNYKKNAFISYLDVFIKSDSINNDFDINKIVHK